jgi:ribosomal protein S18 acetylase RimI-like enzyme
MPSLPVDGVVRFAPGLMPVLKHAAHDQKTHGRRGGSAKGELSDDEILDVLYNASSVEDAFKVIAEKLGKNMEAQVADLSPDEINVYRGVKNVERDVKNLTDGNIRYTEYQTWGQGIYVSPDTTFAENYGKLIGLKLSDAANIMRGESEWADGFPIEWENPRARKPGSATSPMADLGRIKMDHSMSDVRNIYYAGKGFDGFQPFPYETVLYNGGFLTVDSKNAGDVRKHQSGKHDQKTHGQWSSGSGDLPDGWTQQSEESRIQEFISRQRAEGSTDTDERLTKVYGKAFADTDEYAGPNSTRVVVSRDAEVSAADLSTQLKTVADLQRIAPVQDLRVEIGDQAFRFAQLDDGVGGFVVNGGQTIYLRSSSVTDGIDLSKGNLMPVLNEKTYALVHEYGHVLDGRTSEASSEDKGNVLAGAQTGASRYALSEEPLGAAGREAFAEAWTGWVGSQGRLAAPFRNQQSFVGYYAEKYGWDAGGEGRSPSAGFAKAQGRMIIADTFTDEGSIVEFLPEDVVIQFAPGLVPVLKHAVHDQLSHGRRARSMRGYEERTPSGRGRRTRGSGEAPSDQARREALENVDYIMGRTTRAPSWTGPSDPLYVPTRSLGDRVESARRKIAAWKQGRERRSMERMTSAELEALGAKNRERVRRKREKLSSTPPVNKSFDPAYEILQRIFVDVVEPSLWVELVEDPRSLVDLTGLLGDLVDDMLDAVAPVGMVVKFAPGLRPVLKHQGGKHDQSSHGSWADSGSSKLTIMGRNDGSNSHFNEKTRVVRYQPEGKEPTDYVLYANEDFVVSLVKPTDGTTINGYSEGGTNKHEIGHLDITGAGSNPWRDSAKDDNKATITEVAVSKKHQRRGLASAMLRFHRDMYPELDVQHSDLLLPEGKAWAEVAKHQAGKHDQKLHGRWAGQMELEGLESPLSGDYGDWGDRAAELQAARNAGPDEYELRNVIFPDPDSVSDMAVRERIAEYHEYDIENDVADRMSRTSLVEGEDEFQATRDRYYEEALDEYLADYGDEAREAIAAENRAESISVDSMDEVYSIYHEGVNRNGEVVTLNSMVSEVEIYGSNIEVRGEIYDDLGVFAGEFHRVFSADWDGNLRVSHELLTLRNEYQGAGFAQAFNRQAENYYITHGINTINVHAALDGGGYAWASSGFDWDFGNHTHNVDNIVANINDYVGRTPNIPRGLLTEIDSVSMRMQSSPASNRDYPTPKEIADLGRIDGVSNWPGKEIMRGTNWYGAKTLRPEGARVTSTQAAKESNRVAQREYEQGRARAAAERAPTRGQLTMDTAFLEGSLAQDPNYQPGLFPPIPGMVE